MVAQFQNNTVISLKIAVKKLHFGHIFILKFITYNKIKNYISLQQILLQTNAMLMLNAVKTKFFWYLIDVSTTLSTNISAV